MALGRVGMAAVVGFLTVLQGAVPAGAAEEGSGTVSTYTEAWHYETITPFLAEACKLTSNAVPDLGLPVDAGDPCAQLPSSDSLGGAVSIFTANTLHVAKIAGTPVAATYLELDMFDEQGKRVLPKGAEITGGTLTLPVAPTELFVSQADIAVDLARNPALLPFTVLGLVATVASLVGVPVPSLPVPVLPLPELPIPESPSIPAGYVAVENARLVACPISADFFTGTEASLHKPPEIDCAKGFAEAKYHGGPTPKFTVDLDKFASAWKGGNDPTLAIIPARVTAQETGSWIVSFWSKDNDTPGAKPITATLTYTGGGDGTPTGRADLPVNGGGPIEHSDRSGPAAADTGGAPTAGDPPQAGPEAPEEAPDALAMPPLLRTVGYAWKIAWLMPLLLLAGFVLTGRSLTKNLSTTRPTA